MKKQITYLIIFILLIVVGALFYFWPANIQAQEEEEEDTCDPASVTVIARDPDGNFIPNIYFEIYEQTVDVDGKPKPGSKVGSGRISPTLGKGVDTFTPDEDHNGIYALKMWDQNKNVGAFYFYNDIQVGCGSSTTVTEVLGGAQKKGNLLYM